MPSIHTYTCTSSFPILMCSISFTCLNALARTFITMSNISEESRHTYLALGLEESIQSSSLCIMLPMGFFRCSLQVEDITFYSSYFYCSFMKWY